MNTYFKISLKIFFIVGGLFFGFVGEFSTGQLVHLSSDFDLEVVSFITSQNTRRVVRNQDKKIYGAIVLHRLLAKPIITEILNEVAQIFKLQK